MKRIFYIVILLALNPTLVNAFGLGNLDLNSALNEPFDARIQLLSPTADELDSLKINLADNEAFARAKIDRPFILSKLRFDLRRSVDDGPDYIRVYSQDPIREPFLNFLIEVSWSNGRLFREYTVLLDPPLYDPNVRANEFVQVDTPPVKPAVENIEVEDVIDEPAVVVDDPDHQVVYSEAYEEFAKSNKTTSPAVSTANINYSGGDYGPTVKSETLWSIASKMRPDTSISVNKMMMALLKANPDAFINQNINGLKRGQILRLPNESEINALTNAEALAEAQSQYSDWGDIRENLSSAVSERPEVSTVSEPTTEAVEEQTEAIVEEVVPEAELKLVSADASNEATDQVSSVESGSGEELILAQETIQALTQENLELKDRVLESEALLDDLQRLLSLKDDELAALQEQMAATEAEEELMAEAEDAAAEAEEELMAEAEDVAAEAEEELMADAEDAATEAEEELMAEAEDAAAEAEEELMAETEAEDAAAEAEEELMADAEDAAAEAEEELMADVEDAAAEAEEVIEVIDTPPESESADIMGMVMQYIGMAKDIIVGNLMIVGAVVGLILLIIIVLVLLKFRKKPAETSNLDSMTEQAFPDFSSGDLGDTGGAVPDSEAVTVLPDSEAETAVHEETPEVDLGEEDEDAKTQFIAAEETPAVEEPEEEEEDPLQEVNTYLAFEQFDQAEEFVRNVINDDPDNPEYHTKLLEVFYTSGNKKSYEEAAKVLHEKVGGEGEHWNMATAMWQEMSPNRALFEEGADDDVEEDDDADNTGGFLNVTADDEAGDNSADLDFDIGGAEEAAPADETPAAEEEMLDITGSSGEDMLDITGSSDAEDLLDVTAAVGIEPDADTPIPEADGTDDILDISAASGDDLLDVTSAEDSSGEDLLDVTAAANLDLDSEEDLLDVTAATSAGADSSDLLDLEVDDLDIDASSTTDADSVESNEIEFDVPAEGDETVELDLDAVDTSASDATSEDDNLLDFDMSSTDDSNDTASAEDPGLEMDLDISDTDEPVRLDIEDSAEEEISLEIGDEEDSAEEISLDIGGEESSAEEEFSLDIGTDDAASEDGDIELDLSIEEEPEANVEAETESDAPEIDFDFSLDDDSADDAVDLDGTVELPKGAMLNAADDADDDDDEEDHTVFVPRAAQPEEQSAEDEIATKLDLAKAYVELGDKESAKNILDEVMADGNDEQRKQAEDLLSQV